MNRRYLQTIVIGLLLVTAAARARAAEPATAAKANYARPFETPTRPALLTLPPGAVEPAGWLRDWCLAARDGYTGHMDEYDVEFRRAWAADHQMTGQRLAWPKGAWPYEGGGYWFDGLVRLGYMLHDDALIEQAKKRLDVVISHMHPDSILFLWWLNKNRPEDVNSIAVDSAWPMWASGLLGRSLVAYYDASGDQRALRALEMAYGGDDQWARQGWGMSNPWPALQTYTWSGNQQIAAALTTLFSPDGGDRNAPQWSWNRYRRRPNMTPGAEPNDHVVHFLESTVPWATGYLWTGNRELLDATFAWHNLLARDSLQPSGVPVADEYYGPTGAFRGTETCDVAGYLWSQILLLTISGQGHLADRAERAFFNAGPATVSRDFKTHVYFQCPNRLVDMAPPHPHGPGGEGNSYQPTHSPLCCTAALNRIVPNYVMHMWMATYDNGLAATHYGPCKVSARVADRVPVEITCRTDYPFDEAIEMSIQPARESAFPLLVRIPGWCASAEASVNGSPVPAVPDAQGFVRIERSWKPGDTLRLRFPMSASLVTGRDNNAQGAPYASVSYGPLLFALPIGEAGGPNTPDPAARWNYALDAQGKEAGAEVAVERRAMPARWDWPLDAPLVLRVNAVACDWKPEPKNPLPPAPIAKLEPAEQIALVPYGCTKFRISMFPVTERAWQAAQVAARRLTPGKILFLGNSITRHPPAPHLGWLGDWGMAASTPEKDFVHIMARRLAGTSGVAPEILVKNIADFERKYGTYDIDENLPDALAFGADLVVVAIGENVPGLDSEQAQAQFHDALLKLLQRLQAEQHPTIVVRSCFSPEPAKDQILRQACEKVGGIFVDTGSLGKDEANLARSERQFQHAGVGGHPGDKGMQAIADALLGALRAAR